MALPPLQPEQRKQLMYGGALLALMAFGFYTQVYEKRHAQIAELETHLESVRTVNTRSRAIASGGEGDVDQQLMLYRQQLDLAEGLIPSAEEVPDLLDLISAEAQRTGVELTLIQPVGATEEAYYTRRVYDLAVVGRYHAIAEFLTRVASLPRIVTPMGLTVAPVTGAPAGQRARGTPAQDGAEPMDLEARFSIETYVIPSPVTTDDARA